MQNTTWCLSLHLGYWKKMDAVPNCELHTSQPSSPIRQGRSQLTTSSQDELNRYFQEQSLINQTTPGSTGPDVCLLTAGKLQLPAPSQCLLAPLLEGDNGSLKAALGQNLQQPVSFPVPPATGENTGWNLPASTLLQALERFVIPPSPIPQRNPMIATPSLGLDLHQNSQEHALTTLNNQQNVGSKMDSDFAPPSELLQLLNPLALPQHQGSTEINAALDVEPHEACQESTPVAQINTASEVNVDSPLVPTFPQAPISQAPVAPRQSTETDASLAPTSNPVLQADTSTLSQVPIAPILQDDSALVPVPTVQNVVATVSLGCNLDLKDMAMQARNVEYKPRRFAALIMRIKSPRTTALIFSSGKMVCTGAKSVDMSHLAALKYARIVRKLGYPVRFIGFKVQNMVGSCDVKFKIQLERLLLKHAQFATHEPELFPGLVYNMVNPKIVFLIFCTGKVVLTGAKERSQLYEAFRNIYPILKEFRKP